MNILKHLACIMDGNRRWAYARGLPSVLGHREGVQAVNRVITFCLKNRIPHASFYVFSLENLQRSAVEKNYLYQLIVHEAQRLLPQAQEQGIRIRFVGDRELFDESVRRTCEYIENETYTNAQLNVDMLFCYGGQQEIVQAMRDIAHKIERKELQADAITPELVRQHLWTHNAPPPDLIIRTGGFQRLSGFQLYNAAYAELRFLECMWPDLSEHDLEKVVNDFYQCQRRFGT